MKRIVTILASLCIGGLSAGAYALTLTNSATGGANHSSVPTWQLNANGPTSVQLPVNIGSTASQHADLVSNQNTNQANQNSVGNAAAATTVSGATGTPWLEIPGSSSNSSSANAGNTLSQYNDSYTAIGSNNGMFGVPTAGSQGPM
jgi:hypothetical protein